MNNNLDLYVELKNLQALVDEKVDKKSEVNSLAEKNEGGVDSFKQWIFNWFK